MLSETLLRSLYGLRLATAKRRAGTLSGERRSMRRGRSLEFADYRSYTPGDDPRRVDWNVYARLEKAFVKLYEDEQDISVHVLLDASPSMLWKEEVEEHSAKWIRAAQLAIALGYIALTSGDRLMVELSTRERFGPKRGVAAIAELITFIEQRTRDLETRDWRMHGLQPSTTGLSSWWKRYALDANPGICLIISDLLDAEGHNAGLSALGANHLEVRLLHTLCPAELEPEFSGDLRLKDIETAGTQDVSLDEATLRQYRERLEAWSLQVADACRKRGGRYYRINTATPLEQIVMRDLRREGWLK